MVKGFSEMYKLSFFGHFLVANILLYNWILHTKNFLILQIYNFLQTLKVEHWRLPFDVKFVIFGHQTWDLKEGGQIDPRPQHILVFKYPSRDRVKKFCVS